MRPAGLSSASRPGLLRESGPGQPFAAQNAALNPEAKITSSMKTRKSSPYAGAIPERQRTGLRVFGALNVARSAGLGGAGGPARAGHRRAFFGFAQNRLRPTPLRFIFASGLTARAGANGELHLGWRWPGPVSARPVASFISAEDRTGHQLARHTELVKLFAQSLSAPPVEFEVLVVRSHSAGSAFDNDLHILTLSKFS